MKDLLICVLALTWVLAVIRQMGTRRYPRETANHIDRDFRDLMRRAYNHHDRRAAGPGLEAECPIHGRDCDNGTAEAKRREAKRRAVNGKSTD